MTLRTLDDIEALVLARTPEGITLDYKGDFTNNLDMAKKELAKDVSAFANAQGGTLVIGVAQNKQTGEPLWPPVGLPRRIGDRQPIEEWIGQGLNQNIAQRVSLTVRQLDLDDSDRCLVLIDVPPSPRAPHMVTFQGDNRFYRRYYKRQQFESLPAEEYEVREMFTRSLRYADAVGALLDSRGYLDRRSVGFGQNELTERLAAWHHPDTPSTTFVSFLAIPTILTPDALDTASENLMHWINSHRNIWHPKLGLRLVPDMMRYT
ncbi:MAG TPA: ATP-binding protein, partial [Thermomicrobiales bacterium]